MFVEGLAIEQEPIEKFNIHKQAEFTKKSNVSLIVYRIERSWTKGHATLICA